MDYRTTTQEVYTIFARQALASRGVQGHYLVIPTDAEVHMLAEDGHSGYALIGDTFCGVFSHEKTGGQRLGPMLTQAKAFLRLQGLWTLRLDCFAPLAKVYERHGLFDVHRQPVEDGYLPEGWPEELGRPEVVTMMAYTR